MDKPPELALKLYRMQPICTIDIQYHQTGTDSADTFVTLTSTDGVTTKGLWRTYEKYLHLHVGYNSVVELAPEWEYAVEAWETYEKENREEIAILRKLKAKHGDV